MTHPDPRPPAPSHRRAPLPGFCATCGKAQLVRWRLWDERMVGFCCLLPALRRWEELQGEYAVHRVFGCNATPCGVCEAVTR